MPTKIEVFKAAQTRAKWVREHATRATGADSPQNDKHRIGCMFVELRGNWPDALLVFHASHGYYGNSSCNGDLNKDTAEYVAKAITQMGRAIMLKAAELAEADAEKARKAAEAEAREVLAEAAS